MLFLYFIFSQIAIYLYIGCFIFNYGLAFHFSLISCHFINIIAYRKYVEIITFRLHYISEMHNLDTVPTDNRSL